MEKRIIRNIITNIIVQIVLAVSSLIIPRYILAVYGSEMNGLVSSVSQFISYAALVEMGIGDALIIALYRPLAENDKCNVGCIINEGGRLYRRSGYIYTLILILIAIMYPLLIGQQFEYIFVFKITLYIGLVNVIDYFVLGKYKALLIADQKYYVINIVRMIATIILTVGSVILLYINASILLVKWIAVVVHFVEALGICIYVRRRYEIVHFIKKEKPQITQRWNSLICQLCATIVYNTDLVVLTICLPGNCLSEISVYTVYNMVFHLLTNLMSALVNGLNSSFGNLFARGENKKLLNIFEGYELIYFMIMFAADTCFAVLIIPFVACYTNGISDAIYIRYEIGLLFAVCGLMAQIKDISGAVNFAAGRLNEVQKYAIMEAVVNIIISLIMVRKYGIVGVLIGTLISHILMSVASMHYAAKELIPGTGLQTIKRVIRNLVVSVILVAVELQFINDISQFHIWVGYGVVTVVINLIVFIGINYCCEPDVICKMVMTVRRKLIK